MQVELTTKDEILAWKKFKKSKAWSLVLEKLNKRIAECDETINKVGENDVKYSERDVAVIEKVNLENLKNMPDNAIEILSQEPTSGVAIDDEDPYARDEE